MRNTWLVKFAKLEKTSRFTLCFAFSKIIYMTNITSNKFSLKFISQNTAKKSNNLNNCGLKSLIVSFWVQRWQKYYKNQALLIVFCDLNHKKGKTYVQRFHFTTVNHHWSTLLAKFHHSVLSNAGTGAWKTVSHLLIRKEADLFHHYKNCSIFQAVLLLNA